MVFENKLLKKKSGYICMSKFQCRQIVTIYAHGCMRRNFKELNFTQQLLNDFSLYFSLAHSWFVQTLAQLYYYLFFKANRMPKIIMARFFKTIFEISPWRFFVIFFRDFCFLKCTNIEMRCNSIVVTNTGRQMFVVKFVMFFWLFCEYLVERTRSTSLNFL